MRNCLLIIVFSVLSLTAAHAQEYKVKKTTGKMILNLSGVLVEGYNGNEIIFSSERKETEVDPKANGLQTINNSGFLDNTGLGVSVVEKGTTVEVNEVIPNLVIKIMVPKNIIIAFTWNKQTQGANVTFRNTENEIEIFTYDNNVSLENVTGPLTVRSMFAPVTAVFNQRIKGPVFIASVHASVDVAITADTKADMMLKSTMATIMTSPELKIEVQKTEKAEDNLPDTDSLINGKMNGGGLDFRLMSQYGKIYLRKTK